MTEDFVFPSPVKLDDDIAMLPSKTDRPVGKSSHSFKYSRLPEKK